MALNELLKFDKIVPLIPGTGVQFVDFGFSIDKKSDVPVNWGFVDPAERKRNNFVPELLVRGDESPAEGQRMPSYDVAIKDVIAMFDRTWVPLPILRKEAQGYFRGPTNWVRAYLANLAEPDPDGIDSPEPTCPPCVCGTFAVSADKRAVTLHKRLNHPP